MKSEQPILSIIIVNTNDERFLIPCLQSLMQFENSLSKEVIIVDNHSRNDIQILLGEKFPDVSVIKLEYNAGFCKANNIGLRAAKGKYVLLLNPDTILNSNCISSCIEYFETHSNEHIGAVGCRLNNVKGDLQKSFYWGAATMLHTLQTNPFYIKLFGYRIKKKFQQRDEQWFSQISKVDWLCGAFLMMERETVIEKSFYLDEDIFLYSDDVVFGNLIRRNGYSVIYYPVTSITHLGGGGTDVSIKKFEQIMISDWLCMMKIHGKFYFLANQILLFENIFLNEMFFKKQILFHHAVVKDLREKILRKKTWGLWKKYTFIILFQYKRKNSSSGKMLKYHA
ncbi:MAG: glycosyltransferase family 2 protein [Chitinophagales bacterium]|nr:glycosyltransferase family 2 protein [Chitinophagales bacterium]